MKTKQAPVPFSPMQRASLELDRKALHDLGLKMPRMTPKYWGAVRVLSDLENTSPYFYHVVAARSGLRAFYESITQQGYTWQEGAWRKTARTRN